MKKDKRREFYEDGRQILNPMKMGFKNIELGFKKNKKIEPASKIVVKTAKHTYTGSYRSTIPGVTDHSLCGKPTDCTNLFP